MASNTNNVSTTAAATISTDRLRERLAGSQLRGNPAEIDTGVFERLPAPVRDRFVTGLKPAAVLMPVIERRDALTVLLTRRSAALAHHPGQVSFPGGRMEAGDADLIDTALRETDEEVGIVASAIDVIGTLSPMPTVSGYAVTPVVGLVSEISPLRLDPREVAVAFEVPLPFLMSRANERWSERELDGHAVPVVEFRYAGERIWGATASMLLALRQTLGIDHGGDSP